MYEKSNRYFYINGCLPAAVELFGLTIEKTLGVWYYQRLKKLKPFFNKMKETVKEDVEWSRRMEEEDLLQ